MRIAIDIDSTLHHYWDTFRELIRERTGIDLPYEDQTDWHVTKVPTATLREIVLETHQPVHVLAAEPYPGAVETVNAWHRAGHFIHITSHRAPACGTATAAWLTRIGVPFDDLHCSFDKVSRCLELDIDVLVDDSPQNIARGLDEGLILATLVHPWNGHLLERDGVVSAHDWEELAAKLEPVLAELGDLDEA